MQNTTNEEYQNHIINEISNLGGVYLRGKLSHNYDMDFYAPVDKFNHILQFLEKEHFFLLSRRGQNFYFYHCNDGERLMIDICCDLNYGILTPYKISFTKNFLESFLNNPQENELAFKSLRYLFLERNKDKYINYLFANKEEILKNNFYLRHLNRNPFAHITDFSNTLFTNIESKNTVKIFPFLRFKDKFLYITNKIKKHFKPQKGIKTYAIIGADGVGKSTIIDFIKPIVNYRTLYMGSNYFIFQNIYNLLDRKNFICNFFKFFLVYAENWLKWIKISCWCILGNVVFLDRHPSYQYYLIKPPGYWLHRFFYGYLFPKPKKTIILHESPQTIIKRKNELSQENIELLYQAYKIHHPESNRTIWIKNNKMDETINTLFQEIKIS